MDNIGEGRLYVIVRGDLSKSQQAVQAAHAVAEFCLTKNQYWLGDIGPVVHWRNEYLILLKAKDHTDLLIWRERIRAKNFIWTEFKEPDINDETTAVVAYGEGLSDMLKNIPLL